MEPVCAAMYSKKAVLSDELMKHSNDRLSAKQSHQCFQSLSAFKPLAGVSFKSIPAHLCCHVVFKSGTK